MKFTDVVSNETPWQLKIADLQKINFSITGLELIETNKGISYLGTCDLESPVNGFQKDVLVILGGNAIRNQLDKLMVAINSREASFPIEASITKVKQGKNFYWLLDDPIE